MTAKVGVRELKTHASEIVKRVRQGETLVLTYRGETVGRIVPERRRMTPSEEIRYAHELEELIKVISASSVNNLTALELVAEQRREL